MRDSRVDLAVLQEAWDRYAATKDQDAYEALVINYLPLARYLARRALAKAPAWQDPEDILSYAHHGLLNAIERFDPEQGVKFETYGTRRIAGSIVDGQRKQDPLGRTLRKRIKVMIAAVDDLWNELGRQPEVNEIAEQMGETVEAVHRLLSDQRSVAGSLDAKREEGEEHYDLPQEPEAEVAAQVGEMRDMVSVMLSSLTERERLFVLLHYSEGRTLGQVATRLRLTEARCAQLRQEVMESLKS